MTSSIRKLTLLATAAASAFLMTAPAHADVMATSVVNFNNFTLSSGGSQLDYNKDFNFLTYTSSAGYTINLTGFAGQTASSTLPPVNLPAICIGAGCNASLTTDNLFPHLIPPPNPGNYSAADQMETGAPILNVPGGFASPAQVQNGSFVGLTAGNAAGHSEATNNLNSSLIFKLKDASLGVKLDFDVNAYMQAFVSAGELFPGFATASYQIDFTLTNLSAGGAVVFTYSPDVFGNGSKTISLNAPLPVDINVVYDTLGNKSFSATTGALNNTDLYQLSARVQTNTDAQRVVPEPGSLSLIGLALLGAGAASRRLRSKKAA